jgi:hypothetical protein
MAEVTDTLNLDSARILACIDLSVLGEPSEQNSPEMALVYDDVEDEEELWTRLKTDESSEANSVADLANCDGYEGEAVVDPAAYPLHLEIDEIRDVIMQYESQGHYMVNHRFRPGDWYRFHVTAFMCGDRDSYLTGRWNVRRHKLLCRLCARWRDENPLVGGACLTYVDFTIQLKAGAEGLVSIPYYGRPSHFLAEARHFVENRDELVERISKMYLEKYADKEFICWEFHCSLCYVNLFTKNVINVSEYINRD